MGAYIAVASLILIICVLLTLIVLVQKDKGGGLASNFSSSNQFMGVKRTTDFLEKSTWTLAVSLLVLSLMSIFVIPRGTSVDSTDSGLQELYQELPDQQPVQDFAPPPGQENNNPAQQKQK